MLLFDEIVFLCRSLCPENLRAAPFVRFLDEEGTLPEIDDLTYDHLWDLLRSSPFWADGKYEVAPGYDDLLRRSGIFWESGADNHTHGLKIGGTELSANSLSPDRLLFDKLVLDRLSDPSLELVTNGFTEYLLEQAGSAAASEFTQLLVLRDIPNFLTRLGPYHPCIDEIRSDRHLVEFRKWIVQQTFPHDSKLIHAIVANTESTLRDAQARVFLKHYDSRSAYSSIGKSLAGDVIDLLIPGAGTVATALDEWKKQLDLDDTRWQAFAVSAQLKASQLRDDLTSG